MLPLTQDTINLLGIVFVALCMMLLAVIGAAVIMRTIGVVTMD
jgi:hypothetical protein